MNIFFVINYMYSKQNSIVIKTNKLTGLKYFDYTNYLFLKSQTSSLLLTNFQFNILKFWINFNHVSLFTMSSQKLNTFFNFETFNMKFSNKTFNVFAFNNIISSSYINFFLAINLDVPKYFTKSISLKRYSNQIFYVKFINLFMQAGNFSQTQKYLLNSFFLFFSWLKTKLVADTTYTYSFFQIFFLLNTFIFLNNKYNYFYVNFLIPYYLNNTFTTNTWSIDKNHFVLSYILNKLLAVQPLFSFNVYKINKFIRKYSRGKSGKYTLIWKYIAPYKRLFVVIRWLLKDVKFNTSFKFSNRVFETLKNFIFFKNHSFIFKSKSFIHNFVFKNYKKTLLISLNSTN